MKTSKFKSLFITFEGGEGSGKSLQSRALYRRLTKSAIPSVLIHEPGSTLLGEKLSRLVKGSSSGLITPIAELFLFSAARAQLVSTVIRPSLDSGIVVVCDRYTDSTIAYQGYARKLSLATIEQTNHLATGDLKPDITFLLDIPVNKGLKRKRDNDADRFQSEEVAFHERVRKGYLALARKEPDRFFIIDGTLDKQAISEIIWQKVCKLLYK